MKQFLFLFLMVFAHSVSFGYSKLDLVLGKVSNNNYCKELPKREVQYVDDGIVVTYRFSEANLRTDELYPNSTVLEIPGMMLSCVPGEPGVPQTVDAFVLPAGSNPTVSVVSSKYKDLTYDIAPARFPLFGNDTIGYNLSNVPPIEQYNGLMPKDICQLQSISKYRSQPVARVLVSPIQYEVISHRLRVCTEVTYKISYNTTDANASVVYEPGSLLNPNHKLTKAGVPLSSRVFDPFNSRLVEERYLIISHSDFKSSLQPFVKWKKQLGYIVSEMYDDNWDSLKIKNAVKSHYNKYASFMYLLIVGDHSKVPAIISDPDAEDIQMTDYYYACMDGENDLDPDLYYGRWPMRTPEEVANIVEKTIWYERSPAIEDQFYKKGVHIGYFEDLNVDHDPNLTGKSIEYPDGIEDMNFVKSCEDIRNYMIDYNGFDVKRVYSRDSLFYYDNQIIPGVTPKKWGWTYGEGGDVPQDLRVENGFLWDANADKVVDAISEGCSYVLFESHGGFRTWVLSNVISSKNFTSRDIDKLSNKSMFPIVFSMGCTTGKHLLKECMASKFLSVKSAGAVGYFGNTYESHNYYTNALSYTLFNTIWPGYNFDNNTIYPVYNGIGYPYALNTSEHEPVYSLGKILNASQSAINIPFEPVALYNKMNFHCFGDPSLNYNTEIPRSLGYVSIDRNEETREITVEVENAPAYISFYNPIDDRVSRAYTNKFSFRVDDKNQLKYVSVVVTDVNTIPYVDMGEEYNGTVSEIGKSHICGWQSIGGSHAMIDFIISRQDAGKLLSMNVVDWSNGNIIAQVPITDVVADQKQQIGVFVRSGVMVAFLTVNGSPVSQMKMYITQ